MSEANIGCTLEASELRDTTYVDSSLNQNNLSEETEVDSPSAAQTEIHQRETISSTWEDALRQLGQEFALIRQSQGMSVYQLHAQTLVSLQMIQALESGDFRRLPEQIYVLGFVRRIGDALGLDGAQVAASLPVEKPNSLSKGKQSSKFNPFYLTRFHLYLGYIALLIAAVSGLSSISNSTSQQPSADRYTNPMVQSETSQPQK